MSADEWTVVPSQGTLGFEARTTLHDFTGVALQYSGEARLEGGRPAEVRVRVPVDALRTGNDARDRDMRRLLGAPRGRDIVFRAQSFDGPPLPERGTARGTLHGTLRVRGVEREVEVPVSYGRDGPRAQVSGAFPVDIRGFGIEPPRVFLVQRMEPVVRVHFTLTLERR